MGNLNMDSVIKRYNKLMQSLERDDLTVGTKQFEKPDRWNIRDLVCECDWLLSTYYMNNHKNGEMCFSDFKDVRQCWQSETEKLKRFITAYLPFCDGIKCVEYHCSRYDTKESYCSKCDHFRICSRINWQCGRSN